MSMLKSKKSVKIFITKLNKKKKRLNELKYKSSVILFLLIFGIMFYILDYINMELTFSNCFMTLIGSLALPILIFNIRNYKYLSKYDWD